MRWLDATEQVLRDANTPMHYTAVAEQIVRRQLVPTSSKTPAITLHASISLDIKRRANRGLPVRLLIRPGGDVTLAEWEGGPIEEARAALLKSRQKAKRELLRRLRDLDGSDFETFLEQLFTRMGYDVTVTGGTGDDGIDLVAELVLGIGGQRVGIQAKCLGGHRDVGPNPVHPYRPDLNESTLHEPFGRPRRPRAVQQQGTARCLPLLEVVPLGDSGMATGRSP